MHRHFKLIKGANKLLDRISELASFCGHFNENVLRADEF